MPELENVEIKSFRGYVKEEFNLNADIVLIYGDNGCGKTSLLDAIEWGLFNKIERLNNEDGLTNIDKLKNIFDNNNLDVVLKTNNVDLDKIRYDILKHKQFVKYNYIFQEKMIELSRRSSIKQKAEIDAYISNSVLNNIINKLNRYKKNIDDFYIKNIQDIEKFYIRIKETQKEIFKNLSGNNKRPVDSKIISEKVEEELCKLYVNNRALKHWTDILYINNINIEKIDRIDTLISNLEMIIRVTSKQTKIQNTTLNEFRQLYIALGEQISDMSLDKVRKAIDYYKAKTEGLIKHINSIENNIKVIDKQINLYEDNKSLILALGTVLQNIQNNKSDECPVCNTNIGFEKLCNNILSVVDKSKQNGYEIQNSRSHYEKEKREAVHDLQEMQKKLNQFEHLYKSSMFVNDWDKDILISDIYKYISNNEFGNSNQIPLEVLENDIKSLLQFKSNNEIIKKCFPINYIKSNLNEVSDEIDNLINICNNKISNDLTMEAAKSLEIAIKNVIEYLNMPNELKNSISISNDGCNINGDSSISIEIENIFSTAQLTGTLMMFYLFMGELQKSNLSLQTIILDDITLAFDKTNIHGFINFLHQIVYGWDRPIIITTHDLELFETLYYEMYPRTTDKVMIAYRLFDYKIGEGPKVLQYSESLSDAKYLLE